jgi:SapC
VERDLLMPNDAKIETGEGTQIQLSGFLVVDPKKFDQLPDSVFCEWRARGWIGLIYAQLLSSHRWQNLVDLLKLPNQGRAMSNHIFATESRPGQRTNLPDEFRLRTRPVPAGRSQRSQN